MIASDVKQRKKNGAQWNIRSNFNKTESVFRQKTNFCFTSVAQIWPVDSLAMAIRPEQLHPLPTVYLLAVS